MISARKMLVEEPAQHLKNGTKIIFQYKSDAGSQDFYLHVMSVEQTKIFTGNVVTREEAENLMQSPHCKNREMFEMILTVYKKL